MVKDINELFNLLKNELDSKVELVKIDNEKVKVKGKIDDIPFMISFNSKKGLKFVASQELSDTLIDDIRRILLKATGYFHSHVQYDKKKNDKWASVIEWDFKNPDQLLYKYDNNEKLVDIKNVHCYSGGLEVSYSILAYADEIFKPLPKEQQLTEETLIALERLVAKSSRIHDAEARLSEYYASHSLPAMDSSSMEEEDEEKGNSYTKK